MPARRTLFDRTRPGFDTPRPPWTGTAYDWSIALCPACDEPVPMQVVDVGAATVVQYCDICSGRLGVQVDGGHIRNVIDLDRVADGVAPPF